MVTALGVVLIILGLGWSGLVMWGCGMADRQVYFDDWWPALIGAGVAVIGIGLVL